MTNRIRLAIVIGVCASIASVVLYITFFHTSEEERVRKVIDELAKIVMVKDGDTILSRTARLRSRMKEVVDDDVHVNVAELNIDVRGRTKLEEDAAKVGLIYQKADCEFSNVSLRIDPAGTLATVDAVAVVTAVRGGERKADKRDVHFVLRKDGDWKITTIDLAPKKPDAL